MRDYQKQRVYDWQNAIFNAVADTLPDIFVELPLEVGTRFAAKICEAYGIKPPKVVHHRYKDGLTAHYTRWNHTIVLPKNWAVCPKTIAHEAAHTVTDHLFGLGLAAHGKEFVTVYSNIMARFLYIDVDLINQITAEAGIDALNASPVPLRFKAAS